MTSIFEQDSRKRLFAQRINDIVAKQLNQESSLEKAVRLDQLMRSKKTIHCPSSGEVKPKISNQFQ
jgi:hypothetical protein